MPSTRPRASFDPISPEFDLDALVEETPNFQYVDRISCDMIDQQGLEAFDRLVLLHVVIGGKPLVIDGYQSRLDPWTYSSKWLQDNLGDKGVLPYLLRPLPKLMPASQSNKHAIFARRIFTRR